MVACRGRQDITQPYRPAETSPLAVLTAPLMGSRTISWSEKWVPGSPLDDQGGYPVTDGSGPTRSPTRVLASESAQQGRDMGLAALHPGSRKPRYSGR